MKLASEKRGHEGVAKGGKNEGEREREKEYREGRQECRCVKPGLLPLRQRCFRTASLSGIINNSATPVCLVSVFIRTHAYVSPIRALTPSLSLPFLHLSRLRLPPVELSQRFSAARHEHLEHGGMIVSVDRLD